jgi:Zn ribbon nucleic-acid-binding protein
MVGKKCPVCKSTDTEVREIEGLDFLFCNKCKFDESEDWDLTEPGEKKSQKAKARYAVYKRGGGGRTRSR